MNYDEAIAYRKMFLRLARKLEGIGREFTRMEEVAKELREEAIRLKKEYKL